MRNILCGVVILSSALALSGCTTNPSTGRDQLLLVSEDQVSAMGIEATPALLQEYGGQIESRAVREYVNNVGAKLARQVEQEFKDIKWEFYVLDSDVINAFALPPGKVFMSRGLMQHLGSEAELAAVLGHEMGHITARHVSERLSQAMLVQGIAEGASAAVSGSEGGVSQLIPLVVGFGGQGYLLKFGRDQESEADNQGLKYMVHAGYDPRAAMNVMRVLMRADESGRPPEFFSTHPDPERRFSEIQKLIQSQYSHTQNNPEFQTFAQRYRQRALNQLR
jgi:predicted Zn-dependent protease